MATPHCDTPLVCHGAHIYRIYTLEYTLLRRNPNLIRHFWVRHQQEQFDEVGYTIQINKLGVVETKNEKIHVHARTRWWVSEREHGIGHEQHMRVVMEHTTLGQYGSIKCELT